jgi:hypothetical protein
MQDQSPGPLCGLVGCVVSDRGLDQVGSRTTELEIVKQVLRPEQFSLVRAVQRRTGQSLIAVMLDMEMVDDEKLAQLLHQRLNLGRFDPEQTPVDADALLVIEDNFAVDHRCLPIGFAHGRLLLAMLDPLDEETQDYASRMSGYPVEPLVATRTDLQSAREIMARRADAELTARDGVSIPPQFRLAAPAVMFLGYPEGVGKTFLMWNLAHVLSKQHKVLLVEIGLPGPEEEEQTLSNGAVSPFHLHDVDSDLIYVPDPCLLPDALQEVAEQSERQDEPGFELVFAELGEGVVGLRECQIAKWAEMLLLVTEAEHAAESWELIREVLQDIDGEKHMSVGVVFNRAESVEQGEAGFAALEAAARSSKRKDSFRLWFAGSIPHEPNAAATSEQCGKVVVQAFPRRRISRAIRALSKRLVQELESRGIL